MDSRVINFLSTCFFMLTALATNLVMASESKPLPTIGGDVTILYNTAFQIRSDDSICAIKVASRIVYIKTCKSEGEPNIIANIRTQTQNGDERQLIVIQHYPIGTACNGGPLFILELSKDYDPFISPLLDFCGGIKPIIRAYNESLLITFPGSRANHGQGRVPTERWRYQNGIFVKMKP